MKKTPTELMNLSFSTLMVVLTFASFIVFMFTNLFSDRAYGTKRYMLAIIFLAYSFYRAYRMYVAMRATKH